MTMNDYYIEHERYLDKMVDNNVYANVSHLMTHLFNTGDNNEDYADIMYTYDSTYTDDGGEPEYVEALQHWVVSDYLGDKLKELGEMVGDVHNLTVWGRTTCGQAISMDHVIKRCFTVTL